MSYSETIDQYLDGELTGKQLEEFRQQLIADEKLAKEVEEYVNLDNFIRHKIKKEEWEFLSCLDSSAIDSVFDFKDMENPDTETEARIAEMVKDYLTYERPDSPEGIEFRKKLEEVYKNYLQLSLQEDK
ncbi:MAG: hypothetical protein KJ607_00245 [Bacteroidetes bacterium]|nr:hypothetical protein [Bacteroidota bacterium]